MLDALLLVIVNAVTNNLGITSIQILLWNDYVNYSIKTFNFIYNNYQAIRCFVVCVDLHCCHIKVCQINVNVVLIILVCIVYCYITIILQFS